MWQQACKSSHTALTTEPLSHECCDIPHSVNLAHHLQPTVFSCGLVSVIGIADGKVCWLKILKVEFAKVKLAKGAKAYLHFW